MIKTHSERVTPERARELLRGNHDNRPVIKSHVAFFVHALKTNAWTVTPDAVAVAPDGRLLNGQHRLMAIAEAGIAAEMLVATGMPPESFQNTDIGSKRHMSVVTGLPKNLVADVQLLIGIARLSREYRKATSQDVLDTADVWRPVYAALSTVGAGDGKRGMNSAYLRVGAGLRWAVSRSPGERDYVLSSLRALVSSDIASSPPAVVALYRRLSQGSATSGHERASAAARVFHSLDHRRAGKEPLIRDMSETMDEIRQWLTMMPAAFAAGPAKDGHPFLWLDKPKVERRVFGAAAAKAAAAEAR